MRGYCFGIFDLSYNITGQCVKVCTVLYEFAKLFVHLVTLTGDEMPAIINTKTHTDIQKNGM